MRVPCAITPILILLLALPFSAVADGLAGRPDAHAPIGVMGDHTHAAGEIMLSYRWSRMRMSGLRDGASHESARQNLVPQGSFMVVPTDMDMEMHMFGAMFAPTDDVTLMAMLPLVELGMDHRTAAGVRFRTKSSGVGDLKIACLIDLWERDHHKVHFNAGFSFPTGSVDEKDATPAGRVRLPYPMQLGSGSTDVIPGLTYFGDSEGLSWGGQLLGTVRLHENRNDYRLGNRVDASAWLARPWTSWLSTSLRLSWSWWGNIEGRDLRQNPNMVPTADPDRRAGTRIDVLPGINLLVPLGPLGAQRFAIEATLPVFEHLDGPQLETDWRLVVGWQKAYTSIWE